MSNSEFSLSVKKTLIRTFHNSNFLSRTSASSNYGGFDCISNVRASIIAFVFIIHDMFVLWNVLIISLWKSSSVEMRNVIRSSNRYIFHIFIFYAKCSHVSIFLL